MVCSENPLDSSFLVKGQFGMITVSHRCARIKQDQAARGAFGHTSPLFSIWPPGFQPPRRPRGRVNSSRHKKATDPIRRLFMSEAGTPEGTRTPDLQVRNLTFYPTELRAHRRKYTRARQPAQGRDRGASDWAAPQNADSRKIARYTAGGVGAISRRRNRRGP